MIEKMNVKEFSSLNTNQAILPTAKNKSYLTQSEYKDFFSFSPIPKLPLIESRTHYISKIFEKLKTLWTFKPVEKKETFVAHDFLKSVNNSQIAPGQKTLIMLESLKDGSLICYNPKKETLCHKGISFHVLKGANENISLAPVVCISSNPEAREIVSLDPKNSPILQSKYKELIIKLQIEAESKESKKLSAQESLQFISNFVRNEVFDPCSESKVFKFIENWKKNNPSCFTPLKNGMHVPVIDIEILLEAKTGVCRHLTLVTACFLDQMRRNDALENLLPRGKSYYVRSLLARGGHAWNFFVTESPSKGFHVDSLWGVVKDCSKAEDLQFLYHAYGKSQIDGELDRFLKKKAS